MTFDLPINSNVDHRTLVVNHLRHDCLTRHAKAPRGAKAKSLSFEAGFWSARLC